MFEAYLNSLRLVRCHARDLEPSAFRHMQTVRDPKSTLAACGGWSLWVADSGTEKLALAWPWNIIEFGIPVTDVLGIQSNLLMLDDTGIILHENLASAICLQLVERFDWRDRARLICGVPLRH
jgi:Domain of unknown function (DUF4902)